MKTSNKTKCIFQFSILEKYPDAFNAIVSLLNTYGLVSSQNYTDGIIVGKWNPVLKGEFGASINIWTGNFVLVENGTLTNVNLTISGDGDPVSAKIMLNYFFRKLKHYTSATKPKRILVQNDTMEQIKDYVNKKHSNIDLLTQLDEALDVAETIASFSKPVKKTRHQMIWNNRDEITYYPDEDHESHDYEADGYCNECDNYIEDMM